MPLAVMEIRRRYFPRGALALAALWITLGILGLKDRFAPLLSGVDNRTLEANRALEELAVEIRSDPDLAALFGSQDSEHLLAALRQEAPGRAFLARFKRFSMPMATARPARHFSSRSRPGRTRRRQFSASCRGWRGRNRPSSPPFNVDDGARLDPGAPCAASTTASHRSQPDYSGATRLGAARRHALCDDVADADSAPGAARARSPPG